MKTIAVALQKGGTGKTTTTATLAHGLALGDFKVLAIDLDPQGNLALALGKDPGPGLYEWLIEERPLSACVVRARPGLDLVPGDKTTASVKEILSGQAFREQALARALKGAAYDFAFLDCAPSLDILNIAALVAADWVIMPVAMSYLATVGLAQHIESVGELRDMGYGCEIRLVIPTFADRVTRETRTILQEVRQTLGDVVTSPIPRSVRFREAPAYGKTIWEYAPKSPGADAYAEAVGRLVNGIRR